jgi:hypothetical protein
MIRAAVIVTGAGIVRARFASPDLPGTVSVSGPGRWVAGSRRLLYPEEVLVTFSRVISSGLSGWTSVAGGLLTTTQAFDETVDAAALDQDGRISHFRRGDQRCRRVLISLTAALGRSGDQLSAGAYRIDTYRGRVRGVNCKGGPTAE